MRTHDLVDEVVDAELIDDDRLPAVRPGAVPAAPAPAHDPDAWLSDQAQEDVKAGIADSTSTGYKGDMERFAAWCATVGRRPMPAASQTVTEYLSYLKRTPRPRTKKPYGPNSMDRIIAAIRSSHRAAGHEPPDTMGARKVVLGYRAELAERKDPAAKPRKATPADRTVLRRALRELDRTALPGIRDAAVMLLGHAIASRGSELQPLDWPANFTELPGGGLRVAVYRKKRKTWQDVDIPLDPDPELCADRAVRTLVAALADNGYTSGPLFIRMDQHGYLNPPMQRHGRPIGDPTGRMTTEALSDIVQRSIERTGLPGHWRSHSTRRGFVKSSRNAGVDIVRIGRHGGWDDKSRALIGYVDEEDAAGENNPLSQIGKQAAESEAP
ncbi:tyrosine-type recombinase/integrase [Streptomyces sp. NPDC060243]|uniref:tyrosine-type recombinase/integrase n=1 Tax=Streptomyces sp. NPDC060243 TaxID=3347081 RepID=UPI0036646236